MGIIHNNNLCRDTRFINLLDLSACEPSSGHEPKVSFFLIKFKLLNICSKQVMELVNG